MPQARRVRRRTPTTRASRPTPGWVWMFAGMIVGLAVAAVLYLQGADRMGQDFGWFTRGDQPTPAAPIREPAAPPQAAPERSRFQFYELLPRDEVSVPGPQPATPPAQRSTTPPATQPPATPPPTASPTQPPAAPSGRVLLQTGSFREHRQADEMKARLAMMGLQATIREVRVENQVFYRVFLGPFDNEAVADRWTERLRRENYEVLRLPAS